MHRIALETKNYSVQNISSTRLKNFVLFDIVLPNVTLVILSWPTHPLPLYPFHLTFLPKQVFGLTNFLWFSFIVGPAWTIRTNYRAYKSLCSFLSSSAIKEAQPCTFALILCRKIQTYISPFSSFFFRLTWSSNFSLENWVK